MDDFDAKNHLRDLHREADNQRLAQLVEAGAESKQQKVAHRSLFTFSFKLLAWMFAQTRRAASGIVAQSDRPRHATQLPAHPGTTPARGRPRK
jgi:hypothetical protein